MTEFIQHSWTEYITHHTRCFDYKDSPYPNNGYGFDCDKNGKVDINSLPDCAKENYFNCINGTYPVIDCGVRSYISKYRHPSVIRCNCGRKVSLPNFTNTCDCGVDYNMSGQRLAPRYYWGEETGEHWSECY